MTIKHDKVKALIQELSADFIRRIADSSSLITVTNTDVSRDYRNSTVFVTVLPEEKEERAVSFLNRRARDFREYVKAHSKLRLMPHFNFEIDKGEKARQRIEEISNKID